MTSTSSARLLVATGAALADVDEVPSLVRSLIRDASEVLVMTPALVSRLRWIASDTDRARYDADKRLETVLGQIEQLAPQAATQGEIGDETPLTAFDDAIRSFHPDHLLIALRSGDHDAWQERKLVDRIRERFHIPITIFEIDHAGRVPPATDSP